MNENNLLRIVFYNRNIDDYEFIEVKDFEKDKFPIGIYKPIGIEIINNQDTNDGTSRILSLVNMSLYSPEYGTIQSEEIQFGFENVENFGMEYNLNIPTIDENGEFFVWFNIIRDCHNIYFPSSNFVRKYSDNSMRNGAFFAPSPNSKFFNENYEFGNILENMNGYEWTYNIKNNLKKVANCNLTAPAVEVTHLYNPNCKGYGSWYIPSANEWCYILEKLYEINLTLKILIQKQPLYEKSISLLENKEYWTSTLVSNNYASIMHLGCGQLLIKNKYEEALTRAMIKI